MADWALVIGINKYDRLRSLDYAEGDAALMRDFFQNEARFEQIFYFSDTSPDFYPPDGSRQSTRPTYANLRSFLRDFFEKSYLEAGDNFWFFFSGHGIRHQDRDYIMPCDANPRDVEYTAISISYVTERLRRCGADNVVLLLDACRNEGEKAGLGIGLEKQQGVITISSCSPREKSYEIEEIRQGAFTYALLESLRIQGEGNCATVERLYQRLRYRVAEINRDYNKPEQTPYAIAEPASKYHLILLPRQATLQDINTLKKDALTAEVNEDLTLAKHLWTRVSAVSPADPEVFRNYERIVLKIAGLSSKVPNTSVVSNKLGAKLVGATLALETLRWWLWKPSRGVSSSPPPSSPLKNIESEVELRSEKNVDYTRLRDLLADGNWKQADHETRAVMLKVAGREGLKTLESLKTGGYLRREDIKKFPCTDLCTIDCLWIKYSNGRFGFSVQKRIWESVGGKLGQYDYEIYKKFGAHIGWYGKTDWLYYNDLTFTLDAPDGHLPVDRYWSGVVGLGVSGWSKMLDIFYRVNICSECFAPK